MSLVTELIGYFTVYQCEQCEIHICHIGPPLNRADGGCRHIAAALFDLEANVRFSDLQSCTSGQCMWKKRGKRNEGSLPIQDLQTSGSYGVTLKDPIHPRDFNPICIPYNVTELEQDFKAGLLETCPSSSALPFLSSTKGPRHTEEEVRAFISSDVNVCKEESVQSVHVYSMNDYAKVFVSVNTEKVMPTVSKELAVEFLESIPFNEEQAEMINKKTVYQSQSQFWFDQRAGRITASSFYTVCHLRESTDRRNTIKHLMNYCPIAEDAMPRQFTWGHEKERRALSLYIKKQNKNHEKLSIEKSGLIVNTLWPFLGASPDGIRICACCQKKLIEVKSMYAKRNLPPHVAAEENLMLVDGKYEIKKETKWNYQIQGLMGITGIHRCDLVIYTLKGILIVNVKFDSDLWSEMLQKLRNFFVEYIVQELFHHDILKSL